MNDCLTSRREIVDLVLLFTSFYFICKLWKYSQLKEILNCWNDYEYFFQMEINLMAVIDLDERERTK